MFSEGHACFDWLCVAGTTPTCAGSEYVTGCSGASDNTCTAQPVCSKDEYLQGSGAATKGTCTAQPVCSKDEYLQGSGAATKGTCTGCDNADCGPAVDQYRSGAWSGTLTACTVKRAAGF